MNGQRPSFDSTRAVRFDLAQGAVRAAHHDERLLLVPSSALDDLILSASPEAVDALARSMGSAIGRRAAARIGAEAATSVASFVEQLAGEAALSGVGSLSFERWGRAMVVVVEHSPLPTALLAPLVSSALEAAAGRPVWSTLLVRDERSARLVVASESGVARVRAAMAGGTSWGQALTMLHGGHS
jgi:hypothetical protein